MKNKNIILSILFGFLFLLVLIFVVLGKTTNFDQGVYDIIISLRSSFFDIYFTGITKFGNTIMVVLVVSMFILATRNKYGIFLAISAIDCLLLNTIVKLAVQRQRPQGLRLIAQGGYSFPSGHTMMSICVYGYLLYLAITKIKNKILKYSVSVFLFLVILSIGVSRIYVGVHFASDVLAGYLLGTCYLFLLIEVEEKFYLKRG